MSITLPPGRSVDAVTSRPPPSPIGTRFDQAKTEVARIEGPLSPALDQARDTQPMTHLLASVEKSKTELDQLKNRMRHTNDPSLGPAVAHVAQVYDYKSTLATKAVGKTASSIKEIVTAA